MSEGYKHRYRLPPTMGGAEYVGSLSGDRVWLDIPGTGVVPMPADLVTEVIPDEPEEGSLVAVLRPEPGTPPLVWVRLARDTEEPAGRPHWWSYDQNRWCIWEEVYTVGIPRLLTFAGLLIRSGGARGHCATCDTPMPLRLDGKLKLHGRNHDRCKGSNHYPEETRPR